MLENQNNTTMHIALPNRRSKAELITQKLTEIGIAQINFRPAQRSILRTTPEKKQKRIKMIALEAAEQSFRADVPTITFLEKLDKKTMI